MSDVCLQNVLMSAVCKLLFNFFFKYLYYIYIYLLLNFFHEVYLYFFCYFFSVLCYPHAEKRQSLPLKLTPPLTNKNQIRICGKSCRKWHQPHLQHTSTRYLLQEKKLKNNFWTPMPIYINEIAQRTIIKILIILVKTTTTTHKKRGLWF